VDHARWVRALVDVRHARILRAREDVDGNTAAAELAAEIADVHVHAAGLLAAEHGQRAGVHAEHGYTPELLRWDIPRRLLSAAPCDRRMRMIDTPALHGHYSSAGKRLQKMSAFGIMLSVTPP
jgi:hypothetical protein